MADPNVIPSRRAARGACPLVLLAILLAGCVVGPDFQRPAAGLPDHWRTTAAVANEPTAPSGQAWWRTFGDPVLDNLENRAIASNLDVAAARERIVAAKATLGQARAQGAPEIGGQAGYSRERTSTAGVLPITRSLLGLNPASGRDVHAVGFDLYSLGAAASWELDLWSGQARRNEGAVASLEAARAESAGALLSVQAEVARAYFQLRGLQAERSVAQQSLALAVEATRLREALRDRGLAAEADLVDAHAKARALRSDLAGLDQDLAALARGLSVLAGGDPGADPFDLSAPAPRARLEAAPARMPSEMARHRPDIVAAEARLHAATAAVGAAQADFYPQVSLTGRLSLDVLNLRDLGWDGRDTSLGPSISIPIFSGGRLEKTLELRRSEQASAALAYRQAVIGAWREVEDALSASRTLEMRRPDVEEDLAARQVQVARLEQRRARGDIGLGPVLAARADALAAEGAAARHRTAQFLARIQLRRALGG